MRRRAMLGAAALGAVAAVAGTGCTGASPPFEWFNLVEPGAPGAKGAQAAAPAGAGAQLLVGLVTVPEEVDRPQLVLYGVDARPTVLELQRWSEPLKAQLPRALSLALGRELPAWVVAAAPSSAMTRPDWRLAVDVQRLELRTAPAPHAVLHAVWGLSGGGASRPPQSALIEVPAVDASPAALVRAMAQAQQDLARRIAPALSAAR